MSARARASRVVGGPALGGRGILVGSLTICSSYEHIELVLLTVHGSPQNLRPLRSVRKHLGLAMTPGHVSVGQSSSVLQMLAQILRSVGLATMSAGNSSALHF